MAADSLRCLRRFDCRPPRQAGFPRETGNMREVTRILSAIWRTGRERYPSVVSRTKRMKESLVWFHDLFDSMKLRRSGTSRRTTSDGKRKPLRFSGSRDRCNYPPLSTIAEHILEQGQIQVERRVEAAANGAGEVLIAQRTRDVGARPFLENRFQRRGIFVVGGGDREA